MSPRDWLLALLAGATLAALGQAVPPLHLLTHEFVQAFAMVAGIAWYLFVWHRTDPQQRERSLWRGLLGGLALGLGASVVEQVASHHAHGCRTVEGQAWLWVTWVPIAVLATVGGVVLAEATRRRALLALAGVLALCLAHDAVPPLVGIYVSDPLIGPPQFVNQRADMALDPMHLLQRAWLLLFAAMVWSGARALRAPSDGGRRLAVSFCALSFLGLSWFGGSRIGLGWGNGELYGELSGRVEAEGVVVRYPEHGSARLYAEQVATEAAWTRRRIARDWALDDPIRVEILLFEDRDQLEQITGIRAAHAAWRRIYLPWSDAIERTLHHELVHAFHPQLHPNPLLLFNRGLVEGTAQAWELELVTEPAAHARQAAALDNGDLPHAQDFMSLLGFWTVDESAAYDASGSFLGWLVMEYGLDRFKAFNRSLDYEAVYGAELDALDEQWRTFLRGVPVTMAARYQARSLFDARLRPSYIDQTCPKVGPLVEPPKEEASRRWRHRDFAGAATLYGQLFTEKRVAEFGKLRAEGLALSGDVDGAQRALDATLALSDLDDDERYGTLAVGLRMRLRAGDWDAAQAVLRRMAEVEGGPESAHLAATLADPSLRQGVAKALISDSDEERGLVLRRLLEEHPDSADLRYLVTTRGLYPDPIWLGTTSELLSELALQQALAAGDADSCEQVQDALYGAGLAAARIGDGQLARRVAGTLAGCGAPLAAVYGRRIEERLAYEP